MSCGVISIEYTIWCGFCEYWEQESMATSKKQVERQKRKEGWKKKNGLFICTYCQEKDKPTYHERRMSDA